MNGNRYYCQVSNTAGSVNSNTVTLTVNFAPQITTQPVNQTVTAGGNATFTVVATGNPTPSYQWYYAERDFAISGATSATLELTNVTASMNGSQYYCQVSNTVGSVKSNTVTLTVNPVLPTSISFANNTIYTWTGRSTNMGMNISPSDADRSLITWTHTPSNVNVSAISNIYTGVAYISVSNATNGSTVLRNGHSVTLTGTLPNNNSASLTIRSRFDMRGTSLLQYWDYADEILSNVPIYLGKITSDISMYTIYVRAYYAANATQWAISPEQINPEQSLTKIPNTEYTLTSNDSDVTVTRTPGDSNTWTITRTNTANVNKSVTISIITQNQTFYQVIQFINN